MDDKWTAYLPTDAKYEDVNICQELGCTQLTVRRCDYCGSAYCSLHLRTAEELTGVSAVCYDCYDEAHGEGGE